ncbi:sugar phosphate isomerase/epimerase family protein [Noviherbaspirillum suwonense]|jgi:sugar phosphate isomerase/epimerase|uniref:Sugar phosphate isomerase/epimerase n=1 Tax=Noviherbaspirillum suwonense TaxID=1224511 RepID=A0ABY1Q7E2_9BURK|nr:sugar phosphate isomerase/epimerase family protein [Noviherbaspirillum suwonense]SMP62010.1 Sugar phosphate isomerase/epimerase [Noviherbaspirillum suwonense]
MYTVLNVTDDLTHCGHIGHVVNDFSRMCELAATHGFDAVNVDFRADSHMSTSTRRSILRDHGLRLAAFGLPVPLYSEHGDAAFKAGLLDFAQQAQWASLLGCGVVNAYLPPYSNCIGFDKHFQLLAKRLSMLKPILECYDLRLALEFIGPTETRRHARHDFIHTMDGVRCLIAASNLHGHAGFKLDIHHWQYSGASLLDLRHLDPDYFLYVELNDALTGYDLFSMPEFRRTLPLETGVTDVAGFMQVLREKDYAGPVAVEPWSEAIKALPISDAIRAVKDALDRSLACEGCLPANASRGASARPA